MKIIDSRNLLFLHKRNEPKIIIKFAIFSKFHVSISVVSYTARRGDLDHELLIHYLF